MTEKILHKVGKQWKVISVALLMAIGGGAVATHAVNAQSNNGVDATTNDEVNELEQKPSVPSAQSVAPSNVSYVSGNNGSAAKYSAKAQSDKAAYDTNNNVVQRYVNSLNAKFPNTTNSLNNNYNSASDKTNADKNAANSYSNIAAQPNWNSKVSSIAAKSGMNESGFIQSVSAKASSYADATSNGSDLNSQMTVVNSYAQLINNIDNNSALSNEYAAKSVSASANQSAANSVYDHFVEASATYQDALDNAKSASVENSEAEDIAVVYIGLDTATTNSLANELHFNNSSETSVETYSIADHTSMDTDINSVAPYVDVHGNNTGIQFTSYSNAVNSAERSANDVYTLLSDTSEEDQYNSLATQYNSKIASYGVDSASVSDALNSANNQLSSANSVADADNILGQSPKLTELFASEAPTYDANKVSSPVVRAALAALGDNNTTVPLKLDSDINTIRGIFNNINTNLSQLFNVNSTSFNVNNINTGNANLNNDNAKALNNAGVSNVRNDNITLARALNTVSKAINALNINNTTDTVVGTPAPTDKTGDVDAADSALVNLLAAYGVKSDQTNTQNFNGNASWTNTGANIFSNIQALNAGDLETSGKYDSSKNIDGSFINVPGNTTPSYIPNENSAANAVKAMLHAYGLNNGDSDSRTGAMLSKVQHDVASLSESALTANDASGVKFEKHDVVNAVKSALGVNSTGSQALGFAIANALYDIDPTDINKNTAVNSDKLQSAIIKLGQTMDGQFN